MRNACVGALLALAATGCGGVEDPDRNEDGVVTEGERDYTDASWTGVGRDLVRPAAGPDPDARGRVAVAAREDSRRFRMSCSGLDPGSPVEVFAEDGTGAMDSWRTFTAGPRGKLRIAVRKQGFASLPGHALSLAELKGRRIEARTAGGAVLLRGTIPHFSEGGRDRAARLAFEGPGAGVLLRTRLAAKDRAGRQVASLRAEGLAPGAAAEFRIEDAAGALAAVGSSVADGKGRAEASWDSRRGDPLPFEEPDAAALASRAVEVRVGGAVVASGFFPDL